MSIYSPISPFGESGEPEGQLSAFEKPSWERRQDVAYDGEGSPDGLAPTPETLPREDIFAQEIKKILGDLKPEEQYDASGSFELGPGGNLIFIPETQAAPEKSRGKPSVSAPVQTEFEPQPIPPSPQQETVLTPEGTPAPSSGASVPQEQSAGPTSPDILAMKKKAFDETAFASVAAWNARIKSDPQLQDNPLVAKADEPTLRWSILHPYIDDQIQKIKEPLITNGDFLFAGDSSRQDDRFGGSQDTLSEGSPSQTGVLHETGIAGGKPEVYQKNAHAIQSIINALGFSTGGNIHDGITNLQRFLQSKGHEVEVSGSMNHDTWTALTGFHKKRHKAMHPGGGVPPKPPHSGGGETPSPKSKTPGKQEGPSDSKAYEGGKWVISKGASGTPEDPARGILEGLIPIPTGDMTRTKIAPSHLEQRSFEQRKVSYQNGPTFYTNMTSRYTSMKSRANKKAENITRQKDEAYAESLLA